MLKILSVLLLSFIVFNQEIELSESSRIVYKGNFGIDYWYFHDEPTNASQLDYSQNYFADLSFTFQFDFPIEIKVNPRIVYDPDNSDRNRFYFRDLFLDYYSESIELRLGYQTFSWKTVESVSHADFLNQTDLESDLLDPEKFGELSARFRYIFPTESQQSFEVFYIPIFKETRLPVGKNRYSFINNQGANVSNEKENHLYQSSDEEKRAQFAFRYKRLIFDESIDWNVFYFNGYQRFPGIVSQDGINFFHEYRLIEKIGTSFQGNIGNWLLKGELVYNNYQKKLRNQLGQFIRPEYTAYTVGFEYTFYELLFKNQDIGTIVEYIGDTDNDKKPSELEGFRPFQSNIFLGLRYAFNNISDRSILIGSIVSLTEHNRIYQMEYSERLFELIDLQINYEWLDFKAEPLINFKNNSRMKIKLTYHF